MAEGFLLSSRVLFLNPFPRAVMKPVCYAGTLSDMQCLSDSDTGTQIIKGPRHRKRSPTPSQWWLATRCFKPTIYTYNCLTDWESLPSLHRDGNVTLSVEPVIFYSTIRATQNSRLEAVSVLNRWKGCQMQGGRRSHSGAMVTDDNEADGALSGEAGETSFQP